MFTDLICETEFDGEQLLKKLSKKNRARLRVHMTIQQGFRCCYCKEKLTLEKPKINFDQSMYATFEHLIDIFDGLGHKDDRIKHIKIACPPCNSKRGEVRNTQAQKYYQQFLPDGEKVRPLVEKLGWIYFIGTYGPMPSNF